MFSSLLLIEFTFYHRKSVDSSAQNISTNIAGDLISRLQVQNDRVQRLEIQCAEAVRAVQKIRRQARARESELLTQLKAAESQLLVSNQVMDSMKK